MLGPLFRRWLAGVLSALTAVAGCAGCDRTDDPPAASLDVTMTVRTSREADALVIEYTLVNQEQNAIVAFTGVPRPDTHERGKTDQNAVYVTARSNGTVEIAKRVFGPPKGVHPYVAFIVEGTAVPAGTSVDETVRVPLPLTVRRPYDSSVSLPKKVTKAVFCIGVISQGAVQPEPQPSTESTAPAYTHSDPVAAVQHLICSEPFSLG